MRSTQALRCRKSHLMYGRHVGSWRMLCHSRYSLHPLSLWRGFTLELLKVSCVCTHTAACQSAGRSAGGRKWLLDIGSSNTLGLWQRSSVVALLFAPRRNRRIYRGYVFQPARAPWLDCGRSRNIYFLFQPIWISRLLCQVHKWMTANARSP